MIIIDILGWLATAVVIISFIVKNMLWLRIINGIGATLWLIYASLRGDIPLFVVNILILSTHIYWYIKTKN
jgi:hypothetical protein